MSLVSPDDARARGVALPVDDTVAQEIIDGQEAWLARRIGPLTGSRTETFYVGTFFASNDGKVGLQRYTDSVALTDGALTGGATVDPGVYRLVDRGSSVIRTYYAPSGFWLGPYVTATYTPNDETEVIEAIYSLLKLKVADAGASGLKREVIGAYEYEVGTAIGMNPSSARAAIVASILPTHDQLTTLVAADRYVRSGDPVINRREAEPFP